MDIVLISFRPYTSDGFIINEIFSQDCYLSSLINPGDVVLDIGAHIGTFSALAIHRGAQVYSFEPLKENFKLLELNAPLAMTYNHAISFDGETENKHIKPIGFNTGGGKMGDEGEEVECKRFDYMIEMFDHINFLKIDIEGSEIGLLQHPEWLKKVDIIALETHEGSFDKFYDFLFNCGFRFLKAHRISNDLGIIVCKRLPA